MSSPPERKGYLLLQTLVCIVHLYKTDLKISASCVLPSALKTARYLATRLVHYLLTSRFL